MISHAAMNQKNPQNTSGWNRKFVATKLADHTMKIIPQRDRVKSNFTDLFENSRGIEQMLSSLIVLQLCHLVP